MAKYLYGAAVQGIQGFIFQTNKLQEIVGASELVEQICNDFFKVEVGKNGFKEENLILGAAGNIKYIFDDYNSCQELVMRFPKKVMEKAPGITISQAVVKYEEGKLNDSLQKLEDKLREQRNKIPVSFEVGFMGTERSRRTSGVAKEPNPLPKEDELIDEATLKKLNERNSRKLFENISGLKDFRTEDLLFNTDDLKGSWMAVVHADGNGLGTIIQNLNGTLKNKTDDQVKNAFKTFSKNLDEATKSAAQKAFEEMGIKKVGGVFPLRPIILGGDDLSIIISSGMALEFTQKFLMEFKKQTEDKFSFLKNEFEIQGFEKGITACAGIAYVKKSYPFHYAVDLAEKLCSDAKNFVKGKTKDYENYHPEMNGLIPKSALAFFKVQDSFIESSLSTMKKRVANAKGYDFNYGPYLIHPEDGFANVGELTAKLKLVDKFEKETVGKGESKGISKLRRWITEVYKDKVTADFFLDRMEVVNEDFFKEMKPRDLKNSRSIIYDVIQLNSLKN